MSDFESSQASVSRSFDRVNKALARKPSLGRNTFVSTTRMKPGLACEVLEDGNRFDVDMPEQAGGKGTAPTPGMLGRAALGSCLAIGYTLWASRLEVPLTGLQVEVRADSDDAGLFGTADIAAGYAQVGYTVIVESTASEEVVLKMLDEAERHSPWLDNFMRPIDCHRQVRIVAAEEA